MKISDEWCGFKAAVLISPSCDEFDFDKISSLINDDHQIFAAINNDELPDGWEFTETDISGAAGYVLVFDVAMSNMPTVEAIKQVEQVIKNI